MVQRDGKHGGDRSRRLDGCKLKRRGRQRGDGRGRRRICIHERMLGHGGRIHDEVQHGDGHILIHEELHGELHGIHSLKLNITS